MDIKNLKGKIFEAAKNVGFDRSEIYFRRSKNFSVSIYKGEIEKYNNNSTHGISFRGEYNSSMGYAYSERVDESVIEMLIENAKENSQLITSPEKDFIYKGDDEYPDLNLYNEKISNVTVEDKINAALLMEKTVLDFDERIKSCSRSVVADVENETYIANTYGLELSQKSNFIMAYVNASAKDGEQTKTKGELKVCFDFDDIDPVLIGEKAAKKAVDCLGADSLKSGKYKVIIENEAFTDLFGCFADSFNAENVQKGFSLLAGKKGKKIASDIVTIADEPLLKGGYSSTAFDCEGVAAYNKTVVEKGVLKTFLYNLKTAAKDKVKSTGNGFKGSFKGPVGISATNFYIKSGKTPFKTLLKDIDEGVLITEFSGLHSGTNGISGDFSLACSGFYVKGGEIERPVEQITAAGNFYTLLNDIKDLGDDLYFDIGGTGSPSVRIDSMNISGI